MITVEYLGGWGNKMFQYVFARLLSEANNINLNAKCPLPETNIKTFDEPKNKKGTVTIGDEIFRANNPDSKLLQLDPNYDYIIRGFFQDADLYNKHVTQIREFFDINYPDNLIEKTLVTVRLGDFIWDGDNSEIIHYDYYKKTLSNIEGDVDVSVGHYQHNDTKSTEEQEAKYLSYFVKDYFNILPPEEDFLKEFNSSFKYKTMILSNSTWAWWVGFLSKCSNIYTFEKTGWFTPGNHRCHGIHIKNLWNIRNISKPINEDFIDISKM
tara:strand:- start:1411 stop:2214 length:804 start_codon:yes stop_codon:yes gene_type:complete